MDEDAWLAGFIDGEGCFLVAEQNANGYRPILRIAMRIDDLPLLEEIAASMGGRVQLRPARGTTNPGAAWSITAKRDLARMIVYLDRFPLRSRKAVDYGVWRRAVAAYLAGGSRSLGLAEIKDALSEARRFEAPIPNEVSTPQLTLIEGERTETAWEK